MMRHRHRLGCGWSILFFGIFFVVGVGLSIFGWTVVQNARLSENWPSAQGQIVSSYVSENTDEDGTTYGADVTFEYVVDDHRYTADEVNFGQYSSNNQSHAQEIVNRYEEGKSVLVYYNPEKPQTAVLEPGVTWSSYFMLAMGLCFAIVPGIGAPIALFRRR